jgi:hypothetical protein
VTSGRPTRYFAFQAEVAKFKTRALLASLASLTSQQAASPGPFLNDKDLVLPWSASLIAREAIAASAARQSDRRRATDRDLRRLNGMVVDLDDPILDSPWASLDDWQVRMAFQQFPYQQSVFHPAARMRPMYKRSFPASDYKVLSEKVIADLLGSDIDGFVDTGPFFAASAGSNGGFFDPAWLDGPQFEPVLERMPREELHAIFERSWSAPLAVQRARALQGRSATPRIRQYDYNPLVAAPWVGLPGGSFVAPQAWYILARTGPPALYYAGIDAGLGKDFLDDLGRVNELYALEQAQQLAGRAVVHPEIVYDSSGNKKTVDIIVVTETVAWLIEVKSTRASLAAQQSYDAYMTVLHRDIDKAFKQLATTADLIRSRHSAVASLVPAGLPLVGSVVTAEPLYQANTLSFRPHLFDPTIPAAILSMSELEDAIGLGLDMPIDKVAQALTASTGSGGYPDPQGALRGLQKVVGQPPRNPLLDAAWNSGHWQKVIALSD